MEGKESAANLPSSSRESELAQEVERLQRKVCNLQERMEARIAIDQAKCLLMETGITEKEAFGRMRTLSMNTRKPLKEIAEAIILVHEAQG